MFKLTQLVHFKSDADPTARAAVAAALGRIDGQRLVQPTLAGVHNGGDLLAHFQFEDEGRRKAVAPDIAEALASPAVRHVDSAAYAAGLGGLAEPHLAGGVYRALLLRVDRAVESQVLERFEAEVRQMPHYIPAIRNWQLSRVAHGEGAARWTHVWEQEYAGLDGLLGPYMMHPYHWARVDRWFDPESPDGMVAATLCHSFCTLERSVLGPSGG